MEGELREMYVQWPFFREMIDLIAMTLSKTDYSISTNYEKQVCVVHDSPPYPPLELHTDHRTVVHHDVTHL